MRNINEISFEDFSETLKNIDALEQDDRDRFGQMLNDVGRECRLAHELLYAIQVLYDQE